jgi:RNA polymerase sigma-70 factor (ECF subfamily)
VSQTLIRRARAGDEAAFGEVFRTYQRDVARLCRRMLGSEVAAEDATSEVFLRVRRGFDGYAPDRPFRTWLLGIAGHYCIDQLRRRSTEQRLFEPGDLDHAEVAAPGPSPLGQLARAEERRELLAAIEALPEKYRLPLVLRYFADLDFEAIAGILGVTRNQVGTLIFRAKRRLREALGSPPALGDGR